MLTDRRGALRAPAVCQFSWQFAIRYGMLLMTGFHTPAQPAERCLFAAAWPAHHVLNTKMEAIYFDAHKYPLVALNGVIAAAYAALTYVAAAMNLAYGPVQFRVSEALTVLPFLFPGTWPGLFVGCLVANLMSPYGPLDILIRLGGHAFGGMAHPEDQPPVAGCRCPPVLSCMVLTGGMLTWYEVGFSAQFPALFAANALWVGIGEAVVCYLLGMLLLRGLPRVPSLRRYIPEARQGLARARKE